MNYCGFLDLQFFVKDFYWCCGSKSRKTKSRKSFQKGRKSCHWWSCSSFWEWYQCIRNLNQYKWVWKCFSLVCFFLEVFKVDFGIIFHVNSYSVGTYLTMHYYLSGVQVEYISEVWHSCSVKEPFLLVIRALGV